LATALLRPQADQIAKNLVSQGALAEGDSFRYFVTAYPDNGAEEGAAPPRFQITPRPVPVEVSEGNWPELAGSLPAGGDTDFKLALPQRVLDEAARLTRSRSGVETGGILIGHLRWDPALGDIFIEVTEQIHARYAAGTETKLTFTPECWTDVRGAVGLRRRGEIVVGWWHSHPVRVFCAKCPRERQEKCELRNGFLSSDDRVLHRTVFPRAFMPALVASDTAFGEVEFAMFGWRDGLIGRRGFHVIGGADSVGWVRPGDGVEKREDQECEQNSN
jgi:proteasome lid subunit RPN8/RPN11